MEIYRTVPPVVSCFKLNSDGTFESAEGAKPSVYVEDSQVARLFSPAVMHLLSVKYGSVVGVMHPAPKVSVAPARPTFKYILG